MTTQKLAALETARQNLRDAFKAYAAAQRDWDDSVEIDEDGERSEFATPAANELEEWAAHAARNQDLWTDPLTE